MWQQSWSSGNVEQTPQSFQTFVDGAYKANGVVFACMLVRMLTFAQAEFKWQKLDDRSLFGTEGLLQVEKPWDGGSAGELLARMIQDVDLGGNFYAVDRGESLQRLQPDRVSIVLGDNKRIAGYLYSESGVLADAEVFTPLEVAHWSPIPDPSAVYRGMSPLTPIAREVDVDSGLTGYKTKYLKNAATPNMLVRYPQRIDERGMESLRERLNARHGGSGNAFKTMVLDAGADATVIGSTFEQMNLKAVQAAQETRIAAAFSVPPVIVGLSEGLAAATYSNYELAMRRFADLTMVPLWMSAVSALEKLVQVPTGSRLWFDTTHMPALRQTEKDRAETMRVFALAAGELIRAGYDPDTVATSLVAGDASLLAHTGAIPTALYPEGKAPTKESK